MISKGKIIISVALGLLLAFGIMAFGAFSNAGASAVKTETLPVTLTVENPAPGMVEAQLLPEEVGCHYIDGICTGKCKATDFNQGCKDIFYPNGPRECACADGTLDANITGGEGGSYSLTPAPSKCKSETYKEPEAKLDYESGSNTCSYIEGTTTDGRQRYYCAGTCNGYVPNTAFCIETVAYTHVDGRVMRLSCGCPDIFNGA